MRLSKNYCVDECKKATGGRRTGLMNLAAHVDVSQLGFSAFQIAERVQRLTNYCHRASQRISGVEELGRGTNKDLLTSREKLKSSQFLRFDVLPARPRSLALIPICAKGPTGGVHNLPRTIIQITQATTSLHFRKIQLKRKVNERNRDATLATRDHKAAHIPPHIISYRRPAFCQPLRGINDVNQ
jgi:hypothetical protein